ncbi:MAG: hypothetical protein QXJ68_01400 [Methanocellales archaeon]
MRERESSAIEDIARGVAKLMALPFSETFDQVLIESLPKKYAQTTEHLINARIEFLSALKSLLDLKIERLKEVREKIKEKPEKKEKVKVE